jgi:hypothetical protein
MPDENPGLNSATHEHGRWIGQLAPSKRAAAPIVVQEPHRDPVDDDDEVADDGISVDAVETMGLTVTPPSDESSDTCVTIANTSDASDIRPRFVGFDVDMIDDVIRALEAVKRRQEGTDA